MGRNFCTWLLQNELKNSQISPGMNEIESILTDLGDFELEMVGKPSGFQVRYCQPGYRYGVLWLYLWVTHGDHHAVTWATHS
jgi:hypothetical protein